MGKAYTGLSSAVTGFCKQRRCTADTDDQRPQGWGMMCMGAICRSGLRLTREISQQSALAPVTKGELHPGAEKQSDADLDAFIRDTVHSGRRSVFEGVLGHDQHSQPSFTERSLDHPLRWPS